jgi:hypothetical protein
MSFAKLFSRASLSEQFDGRVMRTIVHSRQLHVDLVEQLQANCPAIDFPVNPDGSMSFSALSNLYDQIENGKPFTKTVTRLIHAVLTECCKALDTPSPSLHVWAVKTETTKKTRTEENDSPVLDALDILGNIGKITDTEILAEIVKLAQAQLAKQSPALV